MRVAGAVVVIAVSLMSSPVAEGAGPAGVVAASAADGVVLVDPATGTRSSISAGTVGWLFPAPGGMLFAPDLVRSKTTVIDLRNPGSVDVIDGVTMPRFGRLSDRYVVVSKHVLIVSYPDRALMNRFEIEFAHPWQVEVVADNTVLLVLERLPEGGGEVTFSALNLSEGRLAYRRPLGGDVRRFDLAPSLGAVAFADAAAHRVVIATPATLEPRAVFEFAGSPVDVAFLGGGSFLVTATDNGRGTGALEVRNLKQKKDGRLVVKKSWSVGLDGEPVRIAPSPDGGRIAVGTADGRLMVFEVAARVPSVTVDLPGPPRDLVWCDPLRPGPVLPQWSDNEPPSLELGP